ncbi:MAG TPA: hypothetical protein VKV95_22655 [Terriglobia bacterium]|nr:hypothetical protein [Terriglobia bacterium]
MVSIDSWWDSRVRDRSQALLELVINAIADDYENVEIIDQSINQWDVEVRPETWPARSAVPVSRHEIIKALEELTREGYAQSYCFDAAELNAVAVEFAKDGINDLWFYVTPKGVSAVKKLAEQIDGNT